MSQQTEAAKSQETVEERRRRILRAVSEATESATTFEQAIRALNLLPSNPRRAALLILFARDIARPRLLQAGVPSEELDVYDRLAEKIRSLASDEQLATLREELQSAAGSMAVGAVEDPIQAMAARTVVDVSNRVLQVRVTAGPSRQDFRLDFTKSLEDLIGVCIDWVRWSKEAVEEVRALGLDPLKLVNEEIMLERARKLEEITGELRELISSLNSLANQSRH